METENNTIFLQRSRIVRRKYKNNPIIPCMNRTCTARNHRLRNRICSTKYIYIYKRKWASLAGLRGKHQTDLRANAVSVVHGESDILFYSTLAFSSAIFL